MAVSWIGLESVGESSSRLKNKAGFAPGLAYMKSGSCGIMPTAADHGSGHRVVYAYMPPYRDGYCPVYIALALSSSVSL